MIIIEKYKIRLKQLNTGYKEFYKDEKKVIEAILSAYKREVQNEKN